MGSCKWLSCDSEVRKVLSWAIIRNDFITAAHIPGIMNVEANVESRSSETRAEWELKESYFHSTFNYFRANRSVNFFFLFVISITLY